MKKYKVIILAMLCTACVQKTRKVTVAYYVDVSDFKNVESVSIRGGDKPLTWEKDLYLKPTKKKSLYKIFVTYHTGYKFTEVKFVVNDSFELANSGNRRVNFSLKDTTVYNAKYNVDKR